MVPDVMELYLALGYGSATDVGAFPKTLRACTRPWPCAAHAVSWPPGPGPLSESLVRLAFDLVAVPLRKDEFRLCALFKWGLFNCRKVRRESFLTPRQT